MASYWSALWLHPNYRLIFFFFHFLRSRCQISVTWSFGFRYFFICLDYLIFLIYEIHCFIKLLNDLYLVFNDLQYVLLISVKGLCEAIKVWVIGIAIGISSWGLSCLDVQVNGKVRQKGSTNDMIFSAPVLISYISSQHHHDTKWRRHYFQR